VFVLASHPSVHMQPDAHRPDVPGSPVVGSETDAPGVDMPDVPPGRFAHIMSAQGEHVLSDDFEVEELAAQLVAKLEELIGTTASREFTCLGVVYSVPEAQELMHMTAANLRSQIALVEQDLTACRSITATETGELC